MNYLNKQLKVILNLAKIQSVFNRRFDSGLGGLGLNEFIILLHLSLVKEEKMRRVDLAEKVGLTASGVTRLLLPMEKVGLIKKESNENDARVSFVALASGGKRKLEEAMERAELVSLELIPSLTHKQLEELSETLVKLGGAFK